MISTTDARNKRVPRAAKKSKLSKDTAPLLPEPAAADQAAAEAAAVGVAAMG